MLRHVLFLVLLQNALAAKQQVQLSDSYLPVAMQVIAHLTDQMAFESRDEPTKPTAKPPVKPTKPPSDYKPTTKPTWPSLTTKPPRLSTIKPSTVNPYVDTLWNPLQGWWMSYGSKARIQTTPFHRPGLFAPPSPPKPSDRNTPLNPKSGFLPPFDHNSQYTVIEPQEKPTEEPLLAMQVEEAKPLLDIKDKEAKPLIEKPFKEPLLDMQVEDVKPLIEPAKEESLLPPHFDISSRSEDYNEENLQYLSENVRDLIKMAYDKDDERVVDVWEGVRANNKEELPKGKLSASNLRLLLLYDLLSREAKRQRLSDYSGFSPSVMRSLVESSGGGARAQLSFALARMVERNDCAHDYANNRAREMVTELADDNSKLSSEIRYLQPLVYKN